jgi:hypothetical protein
MGLYDWLLLRGRAHLLHDVVKGCLHTFVEGVLIDKHVRGGQKNYQRRSNKKLTVYIDRDIVHLFINPI